MAYTYLELLSKPWCHRLFKDVLSANVNDLSLNIIYFHKILGSFSHTFLLIFT